MTVRNTDPETSYASADAMGAVAARLRARILTLAHEAQEQGVTISEASAAIPEHRAYSVSPRFAELVALGYLLRVLVGYGKSAKRFPGGVPKYITRWDGQTRRHVIIHWLPEFVPSKKLAMSAQAEMTFESETASAVVCAENPLSAPDQLHSDRSR